MIGVIVQFQKMGLRRKMEGHSSEMGSDEKSVLVQFWKSLVAEKCNITLLWNWPKKELLLLVKAFLAIVNFVCVLAIYLKLAKILYPPLFSPFLCLIIWMVCSYIYF